MLKLVLPPGRINTVKNVVDRAVVLEIHDELVHHLVAAHRARDPLDARIGGHLADEVVGVEIDHAGVAVAAGDRGHVVHVRLRGHGLHRGGDIVIDELMADMRIEDRCQVRFPHGLCLHVLCFHVLCFHVLCFHVLCFHVLCFHVLCFHVLCFHVLCFLRFLCLRFLHRLCLRQSDFAHTQPLRAP